MKYMEVVDSTTGHNVLVNLNQVISIEPLKNGETQICICVDNKNSVYLQSRDRYHDIRNRLFGMIVEE